MTTKQPPNHVEDTDAQPYDDREFKRGEIYFINLEDINNITNHVSHKNRPALIIQNDRGNLIGTTLIVALLTSADRRYYPFQYKVTVNGRESTIMFEQILTIDRNRVLEKYGELTYQQMREADNALMYSLQLNRLSLENIHNIEVTSVISKKTKTGEQIYFEVDIFYAKFQKTTLKIDLTKLQQFDKTITKDIDLDKLQKILDCCKGLNWLVNNNEI